MLSRQFLVYSVVGLLSAVIDVGSMYLLLVLQWPIAVAVTVAFLAAFGFNYLCHQRITFQAAHDLATLLRFVAVVAVNYLFTLVCVWIGVQQFDSAMAGKLVSLPLITINGFLLGKFWIFRTR